ncbi:iron-containing alcohol dehydrogenase [Mesorhizobium sp. B3-1-6]|uniref:iron-containing alcohol dehydrogenase n=1 Tax=Mesorhizobium sp. B3-1-6 TaxID=2589895 RepID=UPI001AEE6707|nr:iron-containing alcohol dehydrogenase [Mesorhizobium sp. B3-1-6]
MQFQLCNPTHIAFGEGSIAELGALVPRKSRIMLLYGGGSIKRNGVYQQVRAALPEAIVTEFGGIEVNPHYETILKAAKQVRRDNVDLILAVGGGSVADAAKFLGAVVHAGGDPWDKLRADDWPQQIVPVGVVLTLPATGSESNPVSVITSTVRELKIPFRCEAIRPRFAILDPSTMATLDRRQRANGAVDAFTHVLEQYLVAPGNTPVQFGFSEALLEVLIEWGPMLVEQNTPQARENIMWAANQALNGLIGAGITQDWSTHMIGHALTELYGVDHARSLTLIMPSLLRYKRGAKQVMLARYARRVWKVDEADDKRAAERAIDLTEDFFRRMGCPVRISELAPTTVSAGAVVAHLERASQTRLGEAGDIQSAQVHEIIALAA